MCRLEDDHAHLKQKDKGDEIVVKGDHEVEINKQKMDLAFTILCFVI